ncbi:transposase [Streptomyces samsunensis]|uniref:transposase n=1 Tax=Streptomyces malaysiensis TaxID=92644 RepID=UPI0015838FB4|nr:transposase [Streptomyces samsunensis]
MPSVLGLLEAREKKVLEEVARLREEAERAQAALGDAERALQRHADARATVAEVLAEPFVHGGPRLVVTHHWNGWPERGRGALTEGEDQVQTELTGQQSERNAGQSPLPSGQGTHEAQHRGSAGARDHRATPVPEASSCPPADSATHAAENTEALSSLRLVWAGNGYGGDEFRTWAQATLGIAVKAVSRPKDVEGFVLLPKRWVVERSNSWPTRIRRNARHGGS